MRELSAPAPRGGIPRGQRVRKRREYLGIQASGERVLTPHFVLVLVARPDQEGARLGVTATRKIGDAVRRNRAKRLIRETFRRTRELWAADVDLVVIVKRPLGTMRLAEVLAEWRRAAPEVKKRTVRSRETLEKAARSGAAESTRAGRA